MNISFYLLNPRATGQTQVYISASKGSDRVRFASGERFYTAYCNTRGKKGVKHLVRPDAPLHLDYTGALNGIRDQLLIIDRDFKRLGDPYTVEQVRDKYWLDIGHKADVTKVDFFVAFDGYVRACCSNWSDSYIAIHATLKTHLEAFEANAKERLNLPDFDDMTWNAITTYFVDAGLTNSTTNKNLKYLKQFLRYAGKQGWFNGANLLDEWKGQQTIKTFKIALKRREIDIWRELRLIKHSPHDKARDLFLLEVLTGQRYSDVDKVLDKNNHDDGFIYVVQQKTGETVGIPIYPELRTHLDMLLAKYPGGFPIMSNQRFNEYLKQVAELAGFTRQHSWVKMVGRKRITETEYRYNLITSHTGRRTFCTLGLKAGIQPELIMKVTGHKRYDQFMDYVKVDDLDIEAAFAEKF